MYIDPIEWAFVAGRFVEVPAGKYEHRFTVGDTPQRYEPNQKPALGSAFVWVRTVEMHLYRDVRLGWQGCVGSLDEDIMDVNAKVEAALAVVRFLAWIGRGCVVLTWAPKLCIICKAKPATLGYYQWISSFGRYQQPSDADLAAREVDLTYCNDCGVCGGERLPGVEEHPNAERILTLWSMRHA